MAKTATAAAQTRSEVMSFPPVESIRDVQTTRNHHMQLSERLSTFRSVPVRSAADASTSPSAAAARALIATPVAEVRSTHEGLPSLRERGPPLLGAAAHRFVHGVPLRPE